MLVHLLDNDLGEPLHAMSAAQTDAEPLDTPVEDRRDSCLSG
jgi:hypothetical protein